MSTPNKARTGLLLFLAAGPILVFFFLYTFGKNQYSLDSYPLHLADLVPGVSAKPSPLLVLDTANADQRTFRNEQKRIESYWDKIQSQPELLIVNSREASLNPEAASWFSSDTVVEITTVKGKSLKRLPRPPRGFLFDEGQNLRGVYGLELSKSVDTLLLEYQILIAK